MSRLLKYLFYALLWAGVAVYVIYARSLARVHEADKRISAVKIEVADSTKQGYLVTSEGVARWLRKSPFKTVGALKEEVDLTGIERVIAKNGFIDEVAAYVDYEGVLRIDIRQQKPFVRLMTEGRNSYLTPEGYVFSSPNGSSLYVPVVTGNYRPPFAKNFVGHIEEDIARQMKEIDEEIEKLERKKLPYYRKEIALERSRAALKKDRVRRAWWRFESAKSFVVRVREKRKEKARLRNQYRYEEIQIQRQIDHITELQEIETNKQKKLAKNYQDFTKLLIFVGKVEKDDFWRSEVVQIVARETPSGALEVDLIPRSGRHVIVFGKLDNVDEKFSRLMTFYRNGLRRIGWDTYKKIDVRYHNQVICRR